MTNVLYISVAKPLLRGRLFNTLQLRIVTYTVDKIMFCRYFHCRKHFRFFIVFS